MWYLKRTIVRYLIVDSLTSRVTADVANNSDKDGEIVSSSSETTSDLSVSSIVKTAKVVIESDTSSNSKLDDSKRHTGYTSGEVLRHPDLGHDNPMCSDGLEQDRRRQLLRWKNVLENIYFRNQPGTKAYRLAEECLKTYRENWESEGSAERLVVNNSWSNLGVDMNSDLLLGNVYDYDAIGICCDGPINLSRYKFQKKDVEQVLSMWSSSKNLEEGLEKIEQSLKTTFNTREKETIHKVMELVWKLSKMIGSDETSNSRTLRDSINSDNIVIDAIISALDLRPNFFLSNTHSHTTDGADEEKRRVTRTIQYLWEMPDTVGFGDRMFVLVWLSTSAAHLERSQAFQDAMRREDERVNGDLLKGDVISPGKIRYRVQIVTYWPGESATLKKKDDKSKDHLSYMNPAVRSSELHKYSSSTDVELIQSYKSSVFFRIFQNSLPNNLRIVDSDTKFELYTGIEIDTKPSPMGYGISGALYEKGKSDGTSENTTTTKGTSIGRNGVETFFDMVKPILSGKNGKREFNLYFRLPFTFDEKLMETVDQELQSGFQLPSSIVLKNPRDIIQKRAFEYEVTRQTLLGTTRIRNQFVKILEKFLKIHGKDWHKNLTFTQIIQNSNGAFQSIDVSKLFKLQRAGLKKTFYSEEGSSTGHLPGDKSPKMHLLLPEEGGTARDDERQGVVGLMLVEKDVFSQPIQKVLRQITGSIVEMDIDGDRSSFAIDRHFVSDYEVFPLVLANDRFLLYDFSARGKNILTDAYRLHFSKVAFLLHSVILKTDILPSQSLSTTVVDGPKVLPYDQAVKNFATDIDTQDYLGRDSPVSHEELVLDQLATSAEKVELVKLQKDSVLGARETEKQRENNPETDLPHITNAIQTRNRNFAVDTQKLDALERHLERVFMKLQGHSGDGSNENSSAITLLRNALRHALLLFKILRRHLFIPGFLNHFKYVRHQGQRQPGMGLLPEKTYWEWLVSPWGEYFKPPVTETLQTVGEQQFCYMEMHHHIWSTVKVDTEFLLDNAPPEYSTKYRPYLSEANPHVMGNLPTPEEKTNAIGGPGQGKASTSVTLPKRSGTSHPPPYFVLYLRLRHYLMQFRDFLTLRSGMAQVLRYMPGSLWNVPWVIVSDTLSQEVSSMKNFFTMRGLTVLNFHNGTITMHSNSEKKNKLDWKLLEMYGDIALLSKASAILSFSARSDGWTSFVVSASQLDWDRTLFGMATPIFTLVTNVYSSKNRWMENERQNCRMCPVNQNVFHAGEILTFWQTVKCRVNVQKVAIYENQVWRSQGRKAKWSNQFGRTSVSESVVRDELIEDEMEVPSYIREREQKGTAVTPMSVGTSPMSPTDVREFTIGNQRHIRSYYAGTWYNLRLTRDECTSVEPLDYDMQVDSTNLNPLNPHLIYLEDGRVDGLKVSEKDDSGKKWKETTRTKWGKMLLSIEDLEIDPGNRNPIWNRTVRERRRETIFYHHPRAIPRFNVPHRTAWHRVFVHLSGVRYSHMENAAKGPVDEIAMMKAWYAEQGVTQKEEEREPIKGSEVF